MLFLINTFSHLNQPLHSHVKQQGTWTLPVSEYHHVSVYNSTPKNQGITYSTVR